MDLVMTSEAGRSRPKKQRFAEPLLPAVAELIRLTKTSEPAHVQRYFLNEVNKNLDSELDEMTLWIRSGWDPDVDTDRIKALIANGQSRMAVNAIIAQMRRELADELQRHKRSKVDALLEG